jgi:hypothetical protein
MQFIIISIIVHFDINEHIATQCDTTRSLREYAGVVAVQRALHERRYLVKYVGLRRRLPIDETYTQQWSIILGIIITLRIEICFTPSNTRSNVNEFVFFVSYFELTALLSVVSTLSKNRKSNYIFNVETIFLLIGKLLNHIRRQRWYEDAYCFY